MPKTKPIQTKKTLLFFWHHSTRYPIKVWALLIMMPLTYMTGLFIMPYIISQILTRISTGAYNHHDIWASFAPLLIIFATAAIISDIVGQRVVAWLNLTIELDVVRDISQRIFTHLMDMSTGFHANRFAGSLVSQANKLGSAYTRLVDATIFALIPLIVSIVATIVILAPRALIYVLILIGLSIIYLIGIVYYSRSVREANAVEASLQNYQTGYLADSITNIMAVKTFSAIQAERNQFTHINDDVYEAGKRSTYALLKRQNYAAILVQSLRISALFIAIAAVGVLRENIATIFLMVTYTSTLANSLWQFQYTLRQYNRALGDAQEMIEILEIEPDIKDPVRPEPSRITKGNITIQNMSFTHGETDEPLFKDFNLAIKSGEKIGLVGRSGSGKTTLTRLLLRFSDLDAGQILIDGQDITRLTQDDVRRAISYVPQEPLLFHRSLHENIAYGKPQARTEEILRAARRAHAHEFIERLPKGYDTLVGERGIKLSGGQRQRVAIARAMLKDAPILVLDEATSALDSESEKLIQSALWSLMEGRTALVIAHRLSTIQRMDRIVVLEEGYIEEQGTHAQLLKSGGTYAKLWTHQSGGFIDEDIPETASLTQST